MCLACVSSVVIANMANDVYVELVSTKNKLRGLLTLEYGN